MRIEHLGGVKFAARARNHEVITDLPPVQEGEDTGMTPPELLLAALGSCVGVYVRNFCAGHNLDCEGLAIDIDWEKAQSPLRIGKIRCDIHLPHCFPDDLREAALKVAKQCMVHNTLHHTPHIEIDCALPKEV